MIYNSPFTTNTITGGGFTAVIDSVPAGGITGNWRANSQSLTGLIPDSQPLPGELGLVIITVIDQPAEVWIGGISYQQVTENPVPGQFVYNPDTGTITVNLLMPILAGQRVYIKYRESIPPAQVLGALPWGESLEFFDGISREEIGRDAWELLKQLNCSGSLTLTRSKGGHPTLSLQVVVLNVDLANAKSLLSDYEKVYYFFKIPFYQKPIREVKNPLENYTTLFVDYEGIHAPRSEYSLLDQFVYLALNQGELVTSGQYGGAGGGIILPNGRTAVSQAPPERVRRLSQLAAESGLNAPPLVTSTVNRSESDRTQLRTELENTAARAGGWLHYDGQEPEIRFPAEVGVHSISLGDSFGVPFEISRQGIPGSPLVDGVLLSSPWHHRAWQPDLNGVAIGEGSAGDSLSQEEFVDPEIEERLAGEPDPEVSNPTILLEKTGYSYRSSIEIDEFSEGARSPGGLAYSGNSQSGFTKTKYTKRRQLGIDLGELNGEKWGWDITSLDTYTYIDPSPIDDPFSLEPIWIYLSVDYADFWKEVKTWNIFVYLDADGYPILREEIGEDSYRPRQEGSPHEAADLIYEADKLDNEAQRLLLDGDLEAAAEKQKEANGKRKEADLYKLRRVPYRKTTWIFYRNLSLDRNEISDPVRPSPCTSPQREEEPPQEPPARYIESEITETDSLYLLDNPAAGEPPIVYGVKERVERIVYLDTGGWYESTTTIAINPDGTEGTGEVVKRDLDSTPTPAARVPKPRTKRDKPKKEKPDNPVTIYFSTPSPIDWDKSGRASVSIPGLAVLADAPSALLELARNENLTAEQTSLNALFRRTIVPGDMANFLGKRWQIQQTQLEARILPGLLVCRSFNLSLGSYLLGLSLASSSQGVCSSSSNG